MLPILQNADRGAHNLHPSRLCAHGWSVCSSRSGTRPRSQTSSPCARRRQRPSRASLHLSSESRATRCIEACEVFFPELIPFPPGRRPPQEALDRASPRSSNGSRSPRRRPDLKVRPRETALASQLEGILALQPRRRHVRQGERGRLLMHSAQHAVRSQLQLRHVLYARPSHKWWNATNALVSPGKRRFAGCGCSGACDPAKCRCMAFAHECDPIFCACGSRTSHSVLYLSHSFL